MTAINVTLECKWRVKRQQPVPGDIEHSSHSQVTTTTPWGLQDCYLSWRRLPRGPTWRTSEVRRLLWMPTAGCTKEPFHVLTNWWRGSLPRGKWPECSDRHKQWCVCVCQELCCNDLKCWLHILLLHCLIIYCKEIWKSLVETAVVLNSLFSFSRSLFSNSQGKGASMKAGFQGRKWNISCYITLIPNHCSSSPCHTP